MSNLIQVYKDLLKSIDVETSAKDMLIYQDVDIMYKGVPFAMPTEENIKTIMTPNSSTRELERNHYIFNPFREDVVQLETLSLNKLRTLMIHKLNTSVAGISESLFALISSPDLQKKAPSYINAYVASLSDVLTKNMKELVDNKTHKHFIELYVNTATKDKPSGFINMFIKKGGKIDGMQYSRLVSTTSPLYKTLIEHTENKDTIVHDVKMRRKDLIIFSRALALFFSFLEEDDKLLIGTNNDVAPAIIALYQSFSKLANRINKIAKDLAFINNDVYKENRIFLKYSVTEFENIVNNSVRELALIPGDDDDISVVKGQNSNSFNGVPKIDNNKILNKSDNNIKVESNHSNVGDCEFETIMPTGNTNEDVKVEKPRVNNYPQQQMGGNEYNSQYNTPQQYPPQQYVQQQQQPFGQQFDQYGRPLSSQPYLQQQQNTLQRQPQQYVPYGTPQQYPQQVYPQQQMYPMQGNYSQQQQQMRPPVSFNPYGVNR